MAPATYSVQTVLAGDYATFVKADAPVGWWRLGDREGYAQAVVSDGPVGYWRLGDALGTTAADSSGNGHTGTAAGGVTFQQPGVLSDGNTAALFDGSTGRISVASYDPFSGLSACSVEVWVNHNGAAWGANETAIYFGLLNTYIAIQSGIALASVDTTAGVSNATFSTIPPTGWHQIVLSWVSGDGARIYVDGVLKAVGTVRAGTITSAPTVYLGNVNNGLFLNGTLDEVSVYNYAISAQQVANHYALRTSTIATVAAATLADASGNGHTMTVARGVTMQQATLQPDLDTGLLLDGNGGAGAFIAPSAGLNFSGAFALEAWVKTTVSGAAANVIVSRYSTGYVLQVASGGGFSLAIYNGASSRLTAFGSGYCDGNWHHVVVSHDGVTTMKMYVDGVLIGTDASFSVTLGAGTSDTFIGNLDSFSQTFNGSLDEIAVYNYALTPAQILNHYLAGHWTAFGDGDLVAPLVVSRGFQSNDADDLVAGPPTFTFGLNNAASNSGGLRGYYWPDSANARPGWNIDRRIRMQVTANGTTRTRFIGWLDVITPTLGLYDDQTVACTAVGWLARAATAPLTGLALQLLKRDDQLLTSLIGLVSVSPAATSLATGAETFPIALDDLDPEQATVLDAIDSTMQSSLDRVYERADGTVVLENRQLREITTADAVVLTDVAPGGTPSLALTVLQAERRRDAVTNYIQVTVHPRRVDAAAVVLYTLQTTGAAQPIAPGSSVVINGSYTDPNQLAQRVGGYNMLISDGAGGSTIGTSGSLPVADFAFGSSAGLSDLSALVTVTVVYEAGQAIFTITNTSTTSTAFVTLLRCRGQGVYDYQPATSTQVDAASVTANGRVTATIDCPYQANPAFAQAVALYILNLQSTVITRLAGGECLVVADDAGVMETLLALDISSAIAVTETVSGLSSYKCWINAVTETYDERCNLTLHLALTPRDLATYFTVDVSTIDGPDVLAAI